MTVRSISFGAPFAWLAASFEAVRKDSGTTLGATALLMLVILVPAVIQQVVLTVMQPLTLGTGLAIQAITLVISTLLVPPLIGGYFRLLHAREAHQPVRATDVFALFQDPAAAKRMIGTALIFLAIYAVLGIAANFAVGGYLAEFFKVLASAQPGKPPAFPPPPTGLLPWCVLFVFLAMVLMTAYMLALAQAALSGRSPIEAIADGFAATVRNLGAFMLFYLAMFVLGLFAMVILGLVVGLIAVLFGLISPVLAIVVITPIYLLLMLMVYVVIFGFNYYAWRGTLGEENALSAQHIVA